MATPSNQQKVILKHMAPISGYTDFKVLAADTGIKQDVFRAQLAKMAKAGWVKVEEEGSPSWGVTDEGLALVSTGDADLSMTDVGLTESQLFQGFGRSTGGIPAERLQVITQVVFNDDPYNLDKVWGYLAQMNVPIDVRRSWWTAWQSYLGRGRRPTILTEQTRAAVIPPSDRTEEQKKEAEKQQLNFDIEPNPVTGLSEVVKIGEGIGQYSLEEAGKIVGLRNQQLRALAAASPPQPPQEPLSQLIIALTPFLKPDTDNKTVTDLITLQFGNMTKAIADAMPKADSQNPLGQLIGLLGSLKELGPLLRPVLGLPEPGSALNPPANQPPIMQLKDSDGNIVALSDLLTIRKFDAEQKREDESAKGKQDFMKHVQGFLLSIGRATERAAQSK